MLPKTSMTESRYVEQCHVEVQVIAGDGNHQNIAAIIAKSMEISFSAALLLTPGRFKIKTF